MAEKRSRLVAGFFFASAAVVLVLSLAAGFSLHTLVSSLEQSYNERLLAEAQASSLIVSADELEAIQGTDNLSASTGAALQRRLEAFATLHGLAEVAYIKPLPSGELQYITSSNPGLGSHGVSPDPFASNEMTEEALSGSIVVTDFVASQDGGTVLTAYAPVYDATGIVVAISEVRVDGGGVLQANMMIRDLAIIFFLCIAIVIVASCTFVFLQVRKEHEREESLRTQRLMISISRLLSSERPFDNRVDDTLATLGTHLEASRSYILFEPRQEHGSTLQRCYFWDKADVEPEEGGRGDRVVTPYRLMRGAFAFNSDQAQKRSAVCCPDVSKSLDGRYSALEDTGAQAFIWAPLYVQDELWGVLALDYTKDRNEFPDRDIQLAESAALDLVWAITRERYSDQREQALDHAVRASEAKSEFLSNMSHEMRTPMNAIIGMTSIALGSDDVERKDYCLEHIRDASEHLLSFVNDVLELSSIQADVLSLTLAPFDIRHAIDGVVNDHVHRMNEHNLAFSVEIDKAIPQTLIGDKSRMATVIGNLLSNAIKFTPEGGTIALRAKHLGEQPGGHCVRIEVEDDGIGMDSAVRDSLFNSFEQAESGANRKYGGTGLGLVISRRLVELMNGQIGVDSTPDKGSLFYFTVVLEEGSPQEDGSQEDGPGKAGSQDDGSQEGVPEAGSPQEDGPRKDGAHWSLPREADAQKDESHARGSQVSSSQEGSPPDSSSRGDESAVSGLSEGGSQEKDGGKGSTHVGSPDSEGSMHVGSSDSEGGFPEQMQAGSGKVQPTVKSEGIADSSGDGSLTPLSPPDLSSYRILLAEDIDINREIVLALLADSGIQIDCCENGLEALTAVCSDEIGYDLVFMDLRMPEMDGLDATRRIREHPDKQRANVPVIAMTANVSQEDVDACLEAGMDDHIGKPISLDEVYRILDRYLPSKG